MSLPALTPVAGVCRNPLVGLRSADMEPVPVGVSIASLAPVATGQLWCELNGAPLSRLTEEQRAHIAAIEEAGGDVPAQMRLYVAEARNWHETIVQPRDLIVWHDEPGRETVRTLLQVALAVAAAYAPELAAAGYQWVAGALAATNIGYNLLIPPRAPAAPTQLPAAGSVFSTSLSGNTARLDQPIWKVLGRVRITPPFAANPYTVYLPSNPDTPDVDTDQWYYAVFALGVGNLDVEKAFIGKTSIAHLQDVLVAQYLPPGTLPSRAKLNVITSDDVAAGVELLEGTYSPAYAASRPGDRIKSIGIDISASQGLGTTSGPLTVSWQVEAREIDDWGRPIGEWQVVGTESITAATNTPQRWSREYTFSAPFRCEVHAVRTNLKNTAADARDGIQWVGLRAELDREVTLNPHTAHFEVVMRASDQLSNMTERDFSVIARGKCRTWDPVTGRGPEIFTRNPAWWLADLWTSPTWGLGLPDDRVDLQGLYEWAQTLDARQDHIDYVFTDARDADSAAQLIARTGRARAFRRLGSVFSIARDELVDVPVTAFTPRNTQPGSMVLHAKLPGREQPDGYVIQYQSNITWDTATVECPCPGFTVSDPTDARYDSTLPSMSNPEYLDLDGVTGAKHAEREGLYQAASMALRMTTVSAKVEMEGVIACFMDAVRWQPQIVGYGQSGDVAFWDESTLVMGLSEPPNWTAPLYLTLIRDDGSLTTPVRVLAGPTAYDVVLPAAPDFELVLDDGGRERPKFILGPADTCDELVKISSIADGGKGDDGEQYFQIEAVIDDERVHLVDNHLLPGPGEIQDPIDDGTDFDDSGSGTFVHARLTDKYFGSDTTGAAVTYTLDTAGVMTDTTTPITYAHEWLAFPAEPADIATFEVMFHLVSGSTAGTTGDTWDTWHDFSTNRTVGFDASLVGTEVTDAVFQIQIRRIGDTAIQASCYVTFHAGHIETGGV